MWIFLRFLFLITKNKFEILNKTFQQNLMYLFLKRIGRCQSTDSTNSNWQRQRQRIFTSNSSITLSSFFFCLFRACNLNAQQCLHHHRQGKAMIEMRITACLRTELKTTLETLYSVLLRMWNDSKHVDKLNRWIILLRLPLMRLLENRRPCLTTTSLAHLSTIPTNFHNGNVIFEQTTPLRMSVSDISQPSTGGFPYLSPLCPAHSIPIHPGTGSNSRWQLQ